MSGLYGLNTKPGGFDLSGSPLGGAEGRVIDENAKIKNSSSIA